jgi:CheY-specific phosphatase CheX
VGSLAKPPADARPVPAGLHEQLLAPFVEAVETALRDVAGTEAALSTSYHAPSHRPCGDLVVVLDLCAATAEGLALGVGTATAAALARRVLSDVVPDPDDALIRDCLGEIANVAAGQAKALLHGTPHAFTFGTPRTLPPEELHAAGGKATLVAVLATDVGEVVVQLSLQREPQRE